MLWISILAGLFAFIICLMIFEAAYGLDNSKQKLKKHLMTINGIQVPNRFFHNRLQYLKRYSLLYKVALIPISLFVIFLVGILMLNNIYIFIFLCIASVLIYANTRRGRAKRRKEQISYSMRDFMISVTNSLKAGASLQNAIENSIDDLKRLPIKKMDNPLLEEIEKVVLDIHIGRSIDEALIAFKNRINTEETDIFVGMTLKLKETGGDITEILSMVSSMISERIIFKRDIMTLTAGKRYEANILTVVPILMLILIALTAPTYIEPLFVTTLGKLMTFTGFVLILLNYFIGQKIVDINI